MTFKPTPGHRHGFAPAACLCEHCSELVLLLRCPKRDSKGRQCGSWRGHRHHPHLLLVDTTFLIALERVDRARFGEIPAWATRTARDALNAQLRGDAARPFVAGRPTLRSRP